MLLIQKHYYLLLLLLCSFFTFSFEILPVQATVYYEPIVEKAELKQNGSLSTPYIYNLTHDFDYISKMIWIIDTADNTFDFNSFDGTTALTNGVLVDYGSVSLIDNNPIRTNHDLMHYGYNNEKFADDVNPRDNIIVTQWLLNSFVPDGLRIDDYRTVTVTIQDDLSSMSGLNNFTVTFKGYKVHSYNHFRYNNYPSSKIYYSGQVLTITLQDLFINETYTLVVQDQLQQLEQQNITIFAENDIQDVVLKYNPFIPDSYNRTSLKLLLLDNTNTTVAIEYYEFIIQEEQIQLIFFTIQRSQLFIVIVAALAIIFIAFAYIRSKI